MPDPHEVAPAPAPSAKRALLKQETGGGCIPGGQIAENLEPTGKKGSEMISWLSAILQGDEVIYLEEFPGKVIEIKIPKNQKSLKVNLSDLAEGLYFGRIVGKNGEVRSFKFVKE